MSAPVLHMQVQHAAGTRSHVGPAPAAVHPGHSPSPDLDDSPAGRCCGPGMSTSTPRPSTSSAATLTADFSSGYSSSSSWPPAAGAQQHPACSACKHQRRKCAPGCPLAPYFPADKPGSFRNSHRLFGIKNILRFLKIAGPEKQDDCMKSMLFEAEVRAGDPVLGSYGVMQSLQRQLFYAEVELDAVRKQLALYGHVAQYLPAPDVPAFLSPVQPRMPPALLPAMPEEQRPVYRYVPDGVKIDEDATIGVKIDEDAMMPTQHDEAELHNVGATYGGDVPSSSSSYKSSNPSPCGILNRPTFGLRFTHG